MVDLPSKLAKSSRQASLIEDSLQASNTLPTTDPYNIRGEKLDPHSDRQLLDHTFNQATQHQYTNSVVQHDESRASEWSLQVVPSDCNRKKRGWLCWTSAACSTDTLLQTSTVTPCSELQSSHTAAEQATEQHTTKPAHTGFHGLQHRLRLRRNHTP